MIASLRGVVASADLDRVVIETGGVGFGVFAPGPVVSSLSRQVGQEAFLHTYLHVRDDALQLYGFGSTKERAFFLALIAISGVGPKVALAILSTYPVADLEAATVRGDTKRFESIPGIGKKLAQRLVIELRDTVATEIGEAARAASPAVAATAGDAFIAARTALENLGLTLREAEAALKDAPEDASVEELVRYALKRKADG